MKAYRLRELDAEYKTAREAWQYREINAKRKSGKKLEYVYKRFDEFFDYAKLETEILGTKTETEADRAKARYLEYLRSKK